MLWSVLALAASPLQSQSAEITALAKQHLEGKGIVGMSVGVSVDGMPVFSRGFGWADREKKVLASADTQYRLGSVSKPVAAIAMMRAVEMNLLSLDQDIRKYVAEWPEDKPGITLRLIMTHTSGIRHYKPTESEVFDHYPKAVDALTLFKGDPLIAPTNTKYSYSTHAWTLAAAALEKTADKPFPNLIAEIANPSSTLRCEDLTKPVPRNASQLYGPVGVNPKPYEKREDNSWKYAGGGMVSTAGDLAWFAGRFMKGQVVDPKTVDLMLTPVGGAAGENQGLAWRVKDDVFNHTGAQQGCAAALFCNRKSGVAVAVMCNTEGGAPAELAQKILQLFPAPPDR